MAAHVPSKHKERVQVPSGAPFIKNKKGEAMNGVKLMHGDCLRLMEEIPDGSIDMILCDLP